MIYFYNEKKEFLFSDSTYFFDPKNMPMFPNNRKHINLKLEESWINFIRETLEDEEKYKEFITFPREKKDVHIRGTLLFKNNKKYFKIMEVSDISF